MSLFIASLNSGSNGNCYYVGNRQEAVLVDAGISCLETEKRMKRLGLSLTKVKAIFISHEHSDHIRGVEVLSRKHQLPVYISPKTHIYSRLHWKRICKNHFKPKKQLKLVVYRSRLFPSCMMLPIRTVLLLLATISMLAFLQILAWPAKT